MPGIAVRHWDCLTCTTSWLEQPQCGGVLCQLALPETMPKLALSKTTSLNHGITELFGLKGTYKGHLVPPPPAMSKGIFN